MSQRRKESKGKQAEVEQEDEWQSSPPRRSAASRELALPSKSPTHAGVRGRRAPDVASHAGAPSRRAPGAATRAGAGARRTSDDSPRSDEAPARSRRGAAADEPGAAGARRPLSHAGGPVEQLSGPSELTAIVQACLGMHPERGVRDHVHGFHSYPARLHPGTAAGLVSALSPERGTVADPFCGCGTVLVEGRRLGRKALGVDLNPLAVRLTRFKTQPLAVPEREALLKAAERVTEHAESRRASAAGPTRRYPPIQKDDFDVHVLLELDGLAHGIKKEPAGPIRQALQLALTSIFSKVARETTAEGTSKRLASGFTIRFFGSRVGELVRQLAEYEALLPERAPGAQVREADARELGALGFRNVDLFITSPPYPGVLDYAEYHRTRLSWLGIDATKFEELEMGARRRLQRLDYESAATEWEADFTRVLLAMRGALSPSGHVAVVLADSLLCGKPYPADVVVERCGVRAGLAIVARGSQRRPHFHRESVKAFGQRPRYEHLLILRATSGAPSRQKTPPPGSVPRTKEPRGLEQPTPAASRGARRRQRPRA